jgi:hypothetical protein
MDKEKVGQAFDAFEKEKYTDSEDIIRGEIKQAVNDHLKDKLGLKEDPIVSPPEPEEAEKDEKDEPDEE